MRIDHHDNAVYIHVHNYILGLSQKWVGSVKFKEGEAFYPIAYIASFKSDANQSFNNLSDSYLFDSYMPCYESKTRTAWTTIMRFQNL